MSATNQDTSKPQAQTYEEHWERRYGKQWDWAVEIIDMLIAKGATLADFELLIKDMLPGALQQCQLRPCPRRKPNPNPGS